MWTKLMSSSSSKSAFSKFSAPGRADQEQFTMAPIYPTKPRNSVNLDEEYSKALRSNSYVDLYSKVHPQLNRTSTTLVKTTKQDQEDDYRLHHALSSPLAYCRHDNHIPDFLLEPSQESLLASTSDKKTRSCRFHLHLNTLLFDFFDTTHQACKACAALLSSIDCARSHHLSISHLLTILSTSQHGQFSTFSQLSSHLELDNPLSLKTLSHFHLIHSRCPTLVRRLTSASRKISQRLKLVHFAKKASGVAVIALLGAVVAAAVVIASHAAVAVAAVPIVAATGMGSWFKGWMRLERAKARVDAAAKGAYIVGRNLDTMSRMVRRVHDEIEHRRDVARMVVRNREWDMVKEVVKEMEGRGGEVGLGLDEQLEELEEHVYLCLITINRSRRLVAQDIMETQEVPVRV